MGVRISPLVPSQRSVNGQHIRLLSEKVLVRIQPLGPFQFGLSSNGRTLPRLGSYQGSSPWGPTNLRASEAMEANRPRSAEEAVRICSLAPPG